MAFRTKPKFCVNCGSELEDDGRCLQCPASKQPKGRGDYQPNRMKANCIVYTENELRCAFNDHGLRCAEKGCVSDRTDGSGPWFCSEHFWKIKGYSGRDKSTATPTRIRELLATLHRREPGQDDEELAA